MERIRTLMKKVPPRKNVVELNEAILEVLALTRGEVVKNSVVVQTQLDGGLPLIQGDRVQLQQVTLNLIMNAVEAMKGVSDASRELLVTTGKHGSDEIFVAVQDSGPGLNQESFDRLFDAFYTTKPRRVGHGIIDLPLNRRSSRRAGMGLSQCGCGRDRSVQSAAISSAVPAPTPGGGGQHHE